MTVCIHSVFIVLLTDESQLTVEQLYVLGKLCIDFMYELHDYYSEVSNTNLRAVLVIIATCYAKLMVRLK